jgi:NAD(P)-dependent dehydrogenase (short-subunit alcohol dehydrogenase family)
MESGFTAASTADEVPAGSDLSGKNAIVTGGHIRLGLEATRAPAKAGASVTVGSRHPDPAAPALTGTERVGIGRPDLLDPASIDALTTRHLDSGRKQLVKA